MKSEAIYKSFFIETKVIDSSEDEIYTVVMSESIPDRSNSIVEVKGLSTENFSLNPMLLFNHDLDKPVGRVNKTYIEGNSLIGEIQFHRLTPLSNEVADMVKNGYLKTVSVGFIPKVVDNIKITTEMKASGIYNGTSSMSKRFVEGELFELSIVTVPSLQSALIKNSLEELEVELKAGAVLNTANVSLIESAIENLNTVLQNAKLTNKNMTKKLKIVTKALSQEDQDTLLAIIEPLTQGMSQLLEQLSIVNELISSITEDTMEEETPVEETPEEVVEESISKRFDETIKNEILKNILGK